jgi:hypothetical protein
MAAAACAGGASTCACSLGNMCCMSLYICQATPPGQRSAGSRSVSYEDSVHAVFMIQPQGLHLIRGVCVSCTKPPSCCVLPWTAVFCSASLTHLISSHLTQFTASPAALPSRGPGHPAPQSLMSLEPLISHPLSHTRGSRSPISPAAPPCKCPVRPAPQPRCQRTRWP